MSHREKLIQDFLDTFASFRKKMIFPGHNIFIKFKITPAQTHLLFTVYYHKDLGIKDIAKLLEISSSATTQLVDGLVENGFIIRTYDEKDRRALKIRLSPKASKQLEEIKKMRSEKVNAFFQALSDQELEQFLALINKIVSNIEK